MSNKLENFHNKESLPYKLDIVIIKATNLVSKDVNGLSDPYCKVSIACDHFKQLSKTKVIPKTLNPTWNQHITLYPQFDKTCVIFTLWDWDLLSKDDFLGCCKYNLSELVDKVDKVVELKLEKMKVFELIDEEVKGTITVKLTLTKIVKNRILCHYNFQDPFDANSKYKKAVLKDVSRNNFDCNFKNLETDNVVQTLGMKCGNYAGKFSGFNYAQCVGNPIKYVPQFTISVWFKVTDPTQDHVILSAMTTNPNDIKLKKIEQKLTVDISEYGLTESAKKIPTKEVEYTKVFKSGLMLGTLDVALYDNFGRSMFESIDVNTNDVVFFEHISGLKKKKRKKKKKLYLKPKKIKEESDSDYDRTEFIKVDKWNHMVITYSGREIKEYINGILIETKKTNFQFIGFGKPLQIGGWDNECEFRGIKGMIDNILIFNHVLNQPEIQKLLYQQLNED